MLVESSVVIPFVCSLGIVPYEYKGNILSHPDCIQCDEIAS